MISRGLFLAATATVSSWTITRTSSSIAIAGALGIADGAKIWRELSAAAVQPGRQLDLDVSRADVIDVAVTALIVERRAMFIRRGVSSEIVGANAGLQAMIQLLHGDEPPPPARVTRAPSPVQQLGDWVVRLAGHMRASVIFIGELVASIGGLARHPSRLDRRGLPVLVMRAGFAALPIVLLLNFLVGLVIAYQSMRFLKLYGANVYVADLVGVSITRELAPLMTAVIITGRSGAAYAAELGTMRVSEEIDALHTMGFRPVPYLVIPRVIALVLVAPALTLLADLVGILGGMVVAELGLGISPAGYVSELRTILVPSDVWTGLVKGAVFGLAIALIGCRNGLTTRGSASDVGRSTTTTVVQSLFAIVLLDTLLTIVFRGYGA